MECKRLGVIGVGHLVGVVDLSENRAAAIGENLGVPYYSDVDEFIRKASPDAVSVVVPTSLHYEVAKKALDNGIHVLIEKPVTTTVSEAEDLLKCAERSDLVLQVGHIERFNSAIQYISKIIHKPLYLESRRLGPFSPRINDVGVVLDLMIHDIDIILSLVNSDLTNISAMGSFVRSEHEDIATAQMAFRNGSIAHINVSRVSERRLR